MEPVIVHGKTHGATRFTPLCASGCENIVQALGLGLAFDGARAGHDPGRHLGFAETGDLGLQDSLWALVLVYPSFAVPFCTWTRAACVVLVSPAGNGA